MCFKCVVVVVVERGKEVRAVRRPYKVSSAHDGILSVLAGHCRIVSTTLVPSRLLHPLSSYSLGVRIAAIQDMSASTTSLGKRKERDEESIEPRKG